MYSKQKIVITGGLGYIGTELCKLYSGETRYKKIIVVDNKFISERVKQLVDWGFEFIQADITDQSKIELIVKDADIVHHLAGITDVAYTKTTSDVEKDSKISKTAIEGTNNILKSISKSCKIIFASTHVVYEGLQSTKLNIEEDEDPCPILTYSKSKYQNELDIKSSNKDYVILRLGSAYGYSIDSMRIGIMPNLFSKMASQNESIKLFSGGLQYKSLVNVIDVARCFKFMAESNIKNEIFHLSKENTTVKGVAELCKKYKPDTNIVVTDDEIPNLGYTLSNKKLISTGFEFLYNVETSIKEMIENWSKKDLEIDLEYTIKGKNQFVDERGVISNFELTEPINLIGYIESKAGTVRANHYHPIQEQKCLLISGRYISVIKDLSDEKSNIKTRIIKPGEIAVIQPNVAHTMIFLEDSIFLNLVRGDRDHENYGVTHTIPYKLVDENFKDSLLKRYSTSCRSCEGKNLEPVLQLGSSPLANNLLNSINDKDEQYPLEMVYCENCHNCQLSYVVPPENMFDTYLYVSSTSKSFRDHFEKAADLYIKKFNLNEKSIVLDIGSNDGIALKPLKNKGINVIGVEPAKNISEIANNNGIFTLNKYFDKTACKTIEDLFGKVDIITASNVFAHSDKLSDMTYDSFSLLKDDGVFIIEVQYLLDTINDLTFDNVYHEHVNYWSVTSLVNFFKSRGFFVIDVEHINTHGGSIRVYVSKSQNKTNNSVSEFLKKEKECGIENYQTYLEFSKKVEKIKKNVNKNISKLKSSGLKLVGYGSPAKATTALNYFGIDHTILDYIVEDNELKHHKLIPGIKVPIFPKSKINEDKPDVIIVMAWNFYEEIKKNNSDLVDKGIVFINIKDLQRDEFSI